MTVYADDILWQLWSHLHTPDSPFTDDDRKAIIDLASGRLQKHGIDAAPMLRHVDRWRALEAREDALRQPVIAIESIAPIGCRTPSHRSRKRNGS